MPNSTKKHPDSDLIDRLGGTSRAAEFFEVSAPSVTGWRVTGLPKARLMYLRAVRPEFFAQHQPPESIAHAEKRRNGGVRKTLNPDSLK